MTSIPRVLKRSRWDVESSAVQCSLPSEERVSRQLASGRSLLARVFIRWSARRIVGVAVSVAIITSIVAIGAHRHFGGRASGPDHGPGVSCGVRFCDEERYQPGSERSAIPIHRHQHLYGRQWRDSDELRRRTLP